MINDWKNKKVGVIGAGVEGRASVEFLLNQEAMVTLLDEKEKIEGIEDLKEKGVEVVEGSGYLDNLGQFDLLVRSPGVRITLPQLLEAEKKGVKITSHTILFFEECSAPIIGVTGTKGKGTTSALIYEMLKEEGLDVYLGGNIGVPPLTFLDKLQPTSWVVLELSSFQLEDLKKSPADAKAMAGKPHIAVMLMITPEHLAADTVGTANYHSSMDEYISAKRNILHWQTRQDYAVLNKDYPAAHESDIYTDGQIYNISTERVVDRGCFIKDGKIILRKPTHFVIPTEEERRVEGSFPRAHGRDSSASLGMTRVSDIQIIDISEILLPGRHNLENVCAAVMAASLAGVSKKPMAKVLRNFKGLEHRLELVREVRGVRYYDDSFSTTPETAIAAIEAFDAPKILILGGSHKGSDFTELGEIISTKESIKAVIGIGIEWERIKEKLRVTSYKLQVIEGLTKMEDVVRNAAIIAEPGDIVLLSPACASFGMFQNYKERGDLFKEAVRRL